MSFLRSVLACFLSSSILPTSETNTSSNVIGDTVNERFFLIASSVSSLIANSNVNMRIVFAPESMTEPYDLNISVSILSFAISTRVFWGIVVRGSPLSFLLLLSGHCRLLQYCLRASLPHPYNGLSVRSTCLLFSNLLLQTRPVA